MRFDDLAVRGGNAAAEVGARSTRPPFSAVLSGHRRAVIAGWVVAATISIAIVGLAVVWTAGAPPPPAAIPVTSAAVPDTFAVPTIETRETCPVTIPGDQPFTPVSVTPEGPPPSYQSAWFGTPDLWTRIHHEGEIWDALPVAADGTLTQKTFWWRDGFEQSAESSPDINVTMELVEGTGPTVVGGDATGGGHPELGQFMIVGVDIPREGCWRITAVHRGATLSYVVWVGDQ